MADNDSTSDILDKLNYLDDTKQQIRAALNNKGLNIDTITPFRNYATEIDTLHIGTDTTDADATSYDIINPRTAYVNDQKITGRIPKITNKFSFDNIEITQTNDSINNLIKDYTMNDGQIFHQEYFNGIDLEGKNFLIYMRPEMSESSAIVFTWNNTETLKMTLNNNTMTLNTYKKDVLTNTLTTYTDLFLSNTPTRTSGSYTGNYFGNSSYYTTADIYKGIDLVFEAADKLNYKYFTLNQSFNETKAISSEANNKINLEQTELAQLGGLKPEILKKNETALGITGTYEGAISEQEYEENLDLVNDILGTSSTIIQD